MMTGATLNAAGILLGGMLGLMVARQFSNATQVALRGMMGIITVYLSLRITWSGLHAGNAPLLKQLAIVLLPLTFGRALGRLLHIQHLLNQVGQFARPRLAEATPDDPDRLYHGFAVCTLLFCAAPL